MAEPQKVEAVCEEGICPLCGKEFEYECREDDYNGGGTYAWTCPHCGAEGKEGYNIVFDGQHYNVRDGEGNDVEIVPMPDPSNGPNSDTIKENESIEQKKTTLDYLMERLPEGLTVISAKESRGKYRLMFSYEGESYPFELPGTCAPGYAEQVADRTIINVMMAVYLKRQDVANAKIWLEKLNKLGQ